MFTSPLASFVRITSARYGAAPPA
ncbi:hypothetical protein AZ034_000091, partial [Pluralibacter gergoviae]